jgi:transposase, IS6 family
VIEQDHRSSKRIVKPMMEFKSFSRAKRTLSGIKAMNMLRKEQGIKQGGNVSQARLIEVIFGVTA